MRHFGNAFLFVVIAISCFLSSCSDKDLENGANVSVTVEGGEDLMQLPRLAGEYDININTDSKWYLELKGKVGYIADGDSTGIGQKTIKLYTTTNRHDEDREATLIIILPEKNDERKEIHLHQLGLNNEPDNADDVDTGNQINAVGYGYDTKDRWASPYSIKAEILKTQECIQNHIITNGPVDMSYSIESVTGSSVTELSNDLSTSAKVGGSGWGFSGEAGASFNMKDFSSNNYEYAISYVNIALISAEIKISAATLRKKWMTPEAYQEINGLDGDGNRDDEMCDYPSNDEGFKDLINAYGTHLVINAKLGGQVKYATKIDISKIEGSYDLNAYAKMSYKKIASAEVSDELKNSYEKNSTHISTKINVLGGGTKEALALSKGDEKTALDAWTTSLTEGKNLALIDFPAKDPMIPLYEMVDKVKFPERYNKLKAYMKAERVKSIESVKMEYQCGTATLLKDIPTFDESDQHNSLIKDVYANERQWVARICNEYIPAIDQFKRVTVVYPVLSNNVKYNMGYFIGDSSHRPAKVCWQGNNVSITENTDEPIGARKDSLIMRGANCPSKSYDDLIDGNCTDALANAPGYNGSYNYSLVKIFDKIWMRENYRANRKEDGDLFGNNFNLEPIYGSCNGSTQCYYNEEMVVSKAGYYHFAPTGWRVPLAEDYLNIEATLKANGVKISSARAFYPDNQNGILGFHHIYVGERYSGAPNVIYNLGYTRYCIVSKTGGYDGCINFMENEESFGQHTYVWGEMHTPARLVQDIE